MKEFNYEVKAVIGTISDDGDFQKAVKLISYNGAAPKVDIRMWRGSKMLKGIALTMDEAKKLYQLLEQFVF